MMRKANMETSSPGDSHLRVIMFGGIGAGNLGNEESARVAAEILEELGGPIAFSVATPFPESADEFGWRIIPTQEGLAATRTGYGRARKLRSASWAEIGSAIRAAMELQRADLVLVPGTGIADDFAELPWGMPASLFVWSCLARLTRTPMVMTCIGAGPVNGRLSRWFVTGAVRLASSVSARDDASAEFLSGVCRKPVKKTCDIVFGRKAGTLDASPGSEPVIGVGVMHYFGWSAYPDEEIHQRYVTTVSKVCSSLVRDGLRVRLLLGQPIDGRTAEEVFERLEPQVRGHVTIAPPTTFEELLAEVAGMKVVVANRYHVLVAALLAGRPVVSVGYHWKNDLLLREFALNDMDRHIDVADASWILEQIRDVLEGRRLWPEHVVEIIRRWHSVTVNELELALGSVHDKSRSELFGARGHPLRGSGK